MDHPVVGLDIGTGASCIYSLLACASRSSWRMLGTDIDEKSVHYAEQNIERNQLADRIRLQLRSSSDPLVPLQELGVKYLDFTICNPPFYSSWEDMDNARKIKSMPASAAFTGSATEMICEGGDIGFATRILSESQVLRSRVKWYSCMLSRLSSTKTLVEKIKKAGISNFAVTNLKAGSKTARWAVAWSYEDWRPPNTVVRHGNLVAALLAPATERTILIAETTSVVLARRLDEKMQSLDLGWQYDDAEKIGFATATANVWSRSARRRQKQSGHARDASMTEDRSSTSTKRMTEVGLTVKITSMDGKVDLQWVRGQDAILFESFCGMVRQVLGQRKSLTYGFADTMHG